MRRLTYEFVKEQFENEGYMLLDNLYKEAHHKLKYKCSNGHVHEVSWAKWKVGRRCPYCSGKAKPSIDLIRQEFEKEGYLLLSTEYVNIRTRLKYKCPKGHIHYVRWSDWRHKGTRCFYCSGNESPTIGFIRRSFAKENYIMLTNEYVNNKKKLSYICPEGHVGKISWNDWSYRGGRCPACFFINNSGDKHYNWKGGISCEPYCDMWADKEFKEDIKSRDNYECQNPDCWGTNKQLCLHHINYNKKECGPTNLITLCKSCNSRANYNRKWHKKFYSNIIKKKYNYREV